MLPPPLLKLLGGLATCPPPRLPTPIKVDPIIGKNAIVKGITKRTPILPEITNFSTSYFILSKIYTDEVDMKQIYHGSPPYTGDNLLA